MYIDSQDSLVAFVERARTSSVLAIDTEFMRERTYYPQLCLLQLATDDEIAVVDPQKDVDVKAIAPLLEDERIVKLLHAGSQDIKILYRQVGVMPRPVFDTQIAASVLGQTLQIGYKALVAGECGVNLKKTDSFTDWSRRPLSDSQVEYAADDVRYLPEIYRKMTERLERLGRLHWLDAEFADLVDPARYLHDPNTRFLHLKRIGQLGARQRSAAREVAAWREREAMRRDICRKRIMSDEQIVEACRREARSLDELYMVRGLRHSLSAANARAVVRCIKAGLDAPADTWPAPAPSDRSEANVDVEVDLLSALARMRAREEGVAFQALVSKNELTDLARGHIADNPILKGWRGEIVGRELLELVEGRSVLRFVDGQACVLPAER